MTKQEFERYINHGREYEEGFEREFLHVAAALGIERKSCWYHPLFTLFTLQEFGLDPFGHDLLAGVIEDVVENSIRNKWARATLKPSFYVGGKAAVSPDHFENGSPCHNFYYRPIKNIYVFNLFLSDDDDE